MLTRLEVDGFKNLFDLKVDFGPYTCIAGPNAVGKSNVFDVIEFLSLISDMPFLEAAQKLRSAGDRPGDPGTLFWYDGPGERLPMKIAAEMIVPGAVTDDFGQEGKPSSTFLRYEVELVYVAPQRTTHQRMGTIRLKHESLVYITQAESVARLGWTMGHSKFRHNVVKNKRKGPGFISTDEGTGAFRIHQDGGSSGQPRRSTVAPRTVLSTINTVDDPTIMAAKREMQQWRKLALEPSAMRAPDDVTGSSNIGANGAHLAASLFRQAEYSGEEEPEVYAAVAATASALTDVRAVDIDFDEARNVLTLQAQLGPGPYLPARALSDGTLRFLALAIIKEDDDFGGVICMEEPENGIHPAKITAMVDLLRELAVDTTDTPSVDNPLRQVIVNTHSPRFVAAHMSTPQDLLLALPRSIVREGKEVRTLDLLPMSGTWRRSDHGYAGSVALIGDYLTQSDNAQPVLDYPEREMTALD